MKTQSIPESTNATMAGMCDGVRINKVLGEEGFIWYFYHDTSIFGDVSRDIFSYVIGAHVQRMLRASCVHLARQ